MPTFDDSKDRSDGSVERWCGSGVECASKRVAKRGRPPEILQSDFVTKPVLNIDVAIDGNQAGTRHITTFDISLPWYYWSDRCASSTGWV